MCDELLSQLAQQHSLRPLDLQFAHLLAPQQPHLALAAALVSLELAAGHVCLPLSALSITALSRRFPEQADRWPLLLGGWDEDRWQAYLLAQPCVSHGERATPLVVSHGNLYLQRLWQDEGTVATFFATACAQQSADSPRLAAVLAQLFPRADHEEPDWQQVAAAVAVTRRVAVISGGPGTGKTTTVARLLAALVALAAERPPRIQLAAPTGKAAARLSESLGQALARLALPPHQAEALPREALTLHRLLGARADSARLRYHRDNPLHLDVLVVDEASMVDLPMMARLIEALPPRARLILLGDRDQLASVEAGAVLGELCRFAEYGFSAPRAAELSRLCAAPIPAGPAQPALALRDAISLLRRSYRFAADSGIGRLAQAVNQGERRAALACLEAAFADLRWREMVQDDDYLALLDACLAGYRPMLEGIRAGQEPAQILAEFARFRPLCALREGPFGLHGLNERIALTLQRAGLLQRGAGEKAWYAGRPVMITRNDASQKLFNGDIGITLGDEQQGWLVWFIASDGQTRAVQPNRLPPHETAWAMTVHKSQGSEFDHTLLVLPSHPSPVVTRELVYTAITRARDQLTVFATRAALERAIRTPTERRSGLMARLLAAATA